MNGKNSDLANKEIIFKLLDSAWKNIHHDENMRNALFVAYSGISGIFLNYICGKNADHHSIVLLSSVMVWFIGQAFLLGFAQIYMELMRDATVMRDCYSDLSTQVPAAQHYEKKEKFSGRTFMATEITIFVTLLLSVGILGIGFYICWDDWELYLAASITGIVTVGIGCYIVTMLWSYKKYFNSSNSNSSQNGTR